MIGTRAPSTEKARAWCCRCATPRRCSFISTIAAKVAPRAHAIIIFDQAGWHGAKSLKTPSNVSLIPLPPRAPELNPQENIWHFILAVLDVEHAFLPPGLLAHPPLTFWIKGAVKPLLLFRTNPSRAAARPFSCATP